MHFFPFLSLLFTYFVQFFHVVDKKKSRMYVVYFNQRLGAALSKHWLKYAFQHFLQKSFQHIAFSSFFQLFSTKNAEKVILTSSLVRLALKSRSKYTTDVNITCRYAEESSIPNVQGRDSVCHNGTLYIQSELSSFEYGKGFLLV